MTTTKSSKPKIPVICGPTAAGKTALGIELCQSLNGEVISADSRQFYTEMSIGTAKPSFAEMKGIPHHFINHCSIDSPVTAGEFERQGEQRIQEILSRKKLPVVVGGSGLFLRSLIEGLDDLPSDDNLRQELIAQFKSAGLPSLLERLSKSDPDAKKSIDYKNQVRVMRAIELVELSGRPLAELRGQNKAPKDFEPIWIGITPEREVLYERIDWRVHQMIEAGLEREARSLLRYRDSDPLKTVGYQELFSFFDGDYNLDEAVRLIKRNSRHYAKRQLTWFRKIDGIKWFQSEQVDELKEYVKAQITVV
ncbi:tRNA (adenosine(37)-N6)-dimethylallyltransferase MiaA [Cryomorphaceae bacterium 1068]|nr:tRNA (adenosine(37)-N6)-dimethylallyltransferase MiaA [Cryomorphaceae bacterium 1068]